MSSDSEKKILGDRMLTRLVPSLSLSLFVGDPTSTRVSTMSSDAKSTPTTTSDMNVGEFCTSLAAKQPTPGGGAAAAVGAAVGSAAAQMAAAYTQRKKDETSGAAEIARALQSQLGDVMSLLQVAEDDAKAYAALQSTWKKDHGLSDDDIQAIQKEALRVPTDLVKTCYTQIKQIQGFIPNCNPNITSDAKVGIHLLAGSARAAFQTVLVNTPPNELKVELQSLLTEIAQIETELLK